MLTLWTNYLDVRRRMEPCLLALLLAGLAACDSAVMPEASAPGRAAVDLRNQSVGLQQALVPSLAASLSSSGTFPSGAAKGANVISPATARTLAEQYAKEFLPYHSSRLADEHGAPIDISALVPDQRVLLAESPVEDPGYSVPKPVRKAMGAYYLITLLQNGVPAVTVAVSALSDDISIRDGHLRAPRVYGNEFRSRGIPLDSSLGAIASPEAIATYVTARTGAVNATEPRYVRRGVDWSPLVGMWRVTLDRGVSVRVPGESTAIVTKDLFVSNDGAFALPQDDSTPEMLFFRDRVIEAARLPGLSWSPPIDVRLAGGAR